MVKLVVSASIPLRQPPRATETGQRVHVDIGCLVGATTIGGGNYHVLSKDEYTTFRFIHIMKSRDETFDRIKKVVARFNADCKSNIRYLVSDSGSEFT